MSWTVDVSDDGTRAEIIETPSWIARLFGAEAVQYSLARGKDKHGDMVWCHAVTHRILDRHNYLDRTLLERLEARPMNPPAPLPTATVRR